MEQKRELKNQIYSEIACIVKALSNSNRLEIIDFISNAPKSVEDIALQTGISVANASQHLQTLKKERIVTTSKKGNHVFYGLATNEVYQVWTRLRDLSITISPFVEEKLNEIRQLYSYEQPVSLKEVKKRKDVVLIDVRPKDEYLKGHFEDSISIPLNELGIRFKEIPKDKLIVAYCRGKFCLMADEAVKLLHSKGYNAKKVEESVLDITVIN